MSIPFAGPQIPTLVQHILDRIDLGHLNPGDVLDEADLSESHGISAGVRALNGQTISIPGGGGTESLNVATAASALCMEFLRQRTA